MRRINLAIIILDIIAILMTAGWITFSVYKGVTYLELFYNYIYVFIMIVILLLNISDKIAKETS